MAKDDPNPQSERPPDSDFQQQNLKAWQPLLTPEWVIGTFFLVGIIFVPIGVVVLEYSNEVVEVEKLYSCGSKDCTQAVGCDDPSDPRFTSRENCSVPIEFKIPEDMQPPIFMYYKLTNFYQNHRRYVKSRSDAQLRGDADADLSSCEPLRDWNNGDGKKDLYPCGLIANSYFNDTFQNATIMRDGAPFVPKGMASFADDWDGTGIAWKSDVDDKFKTIKKIPKDFTRYGPSGNILPKVTDEDFIVWMRTAGLPNFKKLRYRIMNTELKKGDTVTVMVDNTFPVSKFGGEKFIVLSTTSTLGGKNDFLGWAYIAVGTVCLFLSFVFLFKHNTSPRPLGDMKYFNWSNNR